MRRQRWRHCWASSSVTGAGGRWIPWPAELMPISRYLDRSLPLSRNPRESEMRILVPLVRAQAVQTLIAVGDALAKPQDADGKVLGLVEVPRQPENLANQVVHRRRELLRWIAEQENVRGLPARLGILVRVVHN